MSESETPIRYEAYRRVLREVRPYWRELTALTFVGLVGTPLALLLPVPLKIAVDSVLGSEPLPPFLSAFLPPASEDPTRLSVLLAAALTVLSLGVLCRNNLEWLFREILSDRLLRNFRRKLFAHALQISALSHESTGSHDAAYRISYDSPALVWLTVTGLIPLVISCALLFGIVTITLQISPTLGGLALVTTVPLALFIHTHEHSLRKRWHRLKELESLSQATVKEALGALRVVITFGQEDREVQRFSEITSEASEVKRRALWHQASLNCLMGVAAALGGGAVLYVGLTEVRAGHMSVGDLLLVMTYLPQLYGPIEHIGSQMVGQQAAAASAERTFELLDRPPAICDRQDASIIDRARGDIEFRDVSFRYSKAEPVFDGFSLSLGAGARVGLLGRSGSGKTTLVNLLVRIADPSSGAIMLDGRDLRDYRVQDLRRQIAVVAQETFLFSGSIYDNISYGNSNSSREAIARAAERASADGFIRSMPQGYDTLVGEHGMRLSGGERQRIALARAILKDAPILICDEPTSSLDGQTEEDLLTSLSQFMEGRTTFLISHRLSALRGSTVLLEVGSGKVELRSVAAWDVRQAELERREEVSGFRAAEGAENVAMDAYQEARQAVAETPASNLAGGPIEGSDRGRVV